MTVSLYDKVLPVEEISELRDLIQNSGMKEPFDWARSKYFFIGKDKNKLVGTIVYGEIKAGDKIYPRFLHVVLSPEYKRTRKALKLFLDSEKKLKEMGNRQIIAFIRNDLENAEFKRKFAVKGGYTKYETSDIGETYYKNL